MRIDSPTNLQSTSQLSGSFSGSFFGRVNGTTITGNGTGIVALDTTNITLNNGAGETFKEQVEDLVDGLLVEGSGIGLTYDDSANTLEIANTTNIFKQINVGTDGGNIVGSGQPVVAAGLADSMTLLAGNDISLESNSSDQTITITGTSQPNNSTITLTAGSGIGITGTAGNTAFTLDQAAAEGFTFAVDNTVIRTTGNQTMSGTKTFSGTLKVTGNIDGDDGTNITNIADINCDAIQYDAQSTTKLEFASSTVRLVANTYSVFEGSTSAIKINNGKQNVNFEVNGDNHTCIYLDADQDTLFLGNLTDADADNSGGTPAVVNIVNSVNSSKVSATTKHSHELQVVNYGQGNFVGARGGSIAFSGASSGAQTGPADDGDAVYYAHAAIAGIQTASDVDRVGLSFLTHDSDTDTSNMSENMRLTHNGDLHVDRDVIAFSTTISDRRLKKNVKPLTNSLETICRLNGKTFEWIDGNRPGTQIGLIAQEVEEIIPEVITRHTLPVKTQDEETEYLTIQYDQLIPHLIESIKELQSQVNELRERLGD